MAWRGQASPMKCYVAFMYSKYIVDKYRLIVIEN